MQIDGKLTAEEAMEVRRLVGGGKWYRLTLPNLLTTMFLFIPLGFLIQIMRNMQPVSKSDMLWVFVGSPAIAVVIQLFARRQDRAALKSLIEGLPISYELELAGISSQHSNGVHTFSPWGIYANWRIESKYLILETAHDQVGCVMSLRRCGETVESSVRHLLSQQVEEKGGPSS